MADLETRYGKQLIVAETAYAWTLDNGDSLGNSFGPGSDRLGGYRATVQGQATAIREGGLENGRRRSVGEPGPTPRS